MRVVLAPDSFKGTIAAPTAAVALAEGWRSVRPGDDLVAVPMADGGEGTLDAVAARGHRKPVRVTGPDGRPVDAAWALLPDGTGVVELASTSGLALLDRPRPLEAHTRGFGAAIRAALDGGATRLLLAVGGSASTDGGAGVLCALGARFLDDAGRPLPDGGGALARLGSVDLGGLRPPAPGGVQVLTDVRNPLLGPLGAAAVYGPQKGAGPEEVALLERGLARLAALLQADPATPGAGAAGGTAFGLLAWGARLVPGAPEVARAVGLRAAVAEADLVVTGEGRFDDQSADGKVVSHVVALAAEAGVPVVLVAGSVAAPTTAFAATASLLDLVGRDAAFADPAAALRAAGAHLAGGTSLDPGIQPRSG